MILIFIASFSYISFAAAIFPQEYEELQLKTVKNNIGQPCFHQLESYIKALNNFEPWALKMLDSTSRIPRGTFLSKSTNLGDFDLCLGIDGKVPGKYCSAKFTHKNGLLLIREKNISLYNILAICLPSGCSDEDALNIWSKRAPEYYITEVSCQNKSTASVNSTLVATIIFLVVLILIIISSTTYDVIINWRRKETPHRALISFSIIANMRNLTSTRKSNGRISCLNGIRVLALTWIMLGHRWDSYYTLPLQNLKHFISWYYYPSTSLVARAYCLNVNSFFIMGGAVIAYTFLGARAKCSKFSAISYYINRYLRLTPPLAAMILIQVTVFRHLGSGPVWPMTTDYMEDDCRSYWWSALLYIQNYTNPVYTCIIPAWYLSVDMQLYILSPLLLVPLSKSPKKTLICLFVLVTCVTFLTATIYWNEKLTSVFHISQKVLVMTSEEIVSHYIHGYVPTHTRCNSWLLGIILGYLLFEQKRKIVPILSKVTVLLLWATSFAFLGFCLLTGHGLLYVDYNRTLFSIWGSLVNPIWSLAVFWIIFACVSGYAGPINWFLSLPFFEILSKLSYCMYVVHFAVIQFRVGLTRYPILFSSTTLIEGFLGDYVVTVIVALVWYLTFEAPITTLHNLYATKDYRCECCEKCTQFINTNKNFRKKNT